MVRKTAVACFALVILVGIALVDKFSTLLGAFICGVVAYFCATNVLKTWLEGILSKVERAPVRYSRHNHRKKLIKLRSTCASGIILPWLEKIIILVRKFNQKSVSNNSSQLEEDCEQDDFSPCSESSFTFPVELPNIKFCGDSPSDTNEIKTFVNSISRSYVQSWYENISNHEEFVHDLDYILEDVLVNFCTRISNLNMNQLFNQVFILSHNRIYNFCENTNGRFHKGDRGVKNTANQMSQLHPALKNQESEMAYLGVICGTLVDLVGPQDLLLCPLLRSLLVEILTHNLFLPTVNLISDPAFLFWSIAFLLGDSNMISRLTKTKDNKINSHRERTTSMLKRNLELSLPLHKEYTPLLQVSDTAGRRNRLSRTKSFSYNSLMEIEDQNGELSDVQDAIPRMTSDGNLCPNAHTTSSDPWDSITNPEYYFSRPPFSLFPVPGHSRKAEREQMNTRMPSPTRIFPCLPKVGSRSLPRNSSLHSSQSMDELLLPPTNVFLPNGSPFPPPQESPPAPSVDVEQAEEVTEATNLKLFYNIRILSTDEFFDSARKKYVLYCIQYDYLEPSVSESRDGEIVSLVPCTAMVRRRFREFLALQYRLQQSKLKKHLNGIKGPSKWLSGPFPSTDKHNVEKRRIFLQDYLQKLCMREVLSSSPELHEFLAYKGDAHIAFVKKAPDLPVPRIDKMVVKGVMGAIDLLKTALPSMPQESPCCGDGDKSHLSTRSLLTGFTRSKSDTKLPLLEFSCRVERMSPLSQQIYNFLDSFDTSSSPEDSRPSSPTLMSPFPRDGPSRGFTSIPAWRRAASRLDSLQSPPPPTGPRPRGDGCDSVDLAQEEVDRRASQIEKIQESFQAEIPLANTLVDSVLCSLFPSHPLSDDYSVVTVKVLVGDLLHKWLQKELLLLSSRERGIHYLHNLHEALWPSSGQPGQKVKDLDVCRDAALQAIIALFPGKLRYFGIPDIACNVNVFLNSLQDCQSNRNLLYQIIDVVVDMMCAQDLQQSIL